MTFEVLAYDPNNNLKSISIIAEYNGTSQKEYIPVIVSRNDTGILKISFVPDLVNVSSFVVMARDSIGLAATWTPKVIYCLCNQLLYYPCDFTFRKNVSGMKYKKLFKEVNTFSHDNDNLEK